MAVRVNPSIARLWEDVVIASVRYYLVRPGGGVLEGSLGTSAEQIGWVLCRDRKT